ncbi:MAG: 1-acyl-sn-glycerol-3-phosphate acyltransferase [Alphaproteobacteria bacterium]|nr:1-acyl-sn-glycerol-3-phosphate acyltransferase [Alphaproteobacteria bacterium]
MSLVVRILGIWLAYEVVRHFVVRWLRRRFQESAADFVRRHRIQMESARFIDRIWIRERLAQDPTIEAAVVEATRKSDLTLREVRRKVDTYVEEIAPFFSMSAYYRFGATIARRMVDFAFEMVVEPGGFERQARDVPPEAVRVYVINHRANMDPLILAYGLLRHVPMSYAVGEWALVWPLSWLFRMFGSYFVRRGERDPLYHVVLERFVQLIAGQGAVTGFFIEGGLSRDGALRAPKTGLLDYIVKLRRDQPDREIVFMPVGLNYDRVLEDRILTREKDGPLPKPTLPERLLNLGALAFWIPVLVAANLVKVASGSHRKLGNAAVWFGEPLALTDWPGGEGLHALDDEPRREAMQALGEELLYRRIGAVVPATVVPVFASAFLEEGPEDDGSVRDRIRATLRRLRETGAPLAFGAAFASIEGRRASPHEGASITHDLDATILDAEEAEQVHLLASMTLLRRRILRRVETPTGRGLELTDGSEDVLRYYALSISHHLASSPA